MSKDAFARHRGVRIRYRVEGSGPAVMLGHGFTGRIEMWEATGWLPRIVDDYRAILIDFRGHGQSDKPRDPAAYSIDERAADVLAVLDAAEVDRVHYLGSSLGGWHGLCVAARAPERMSSLAVGGCPALGQSMAPYRRLLARGLTAWIEHVEHSLGALPVSLWNGLSANDVEALAASVADDRPSLETVARALSVPVLFFAGGRDPLRDAIEESAAITPRGRFVELCGLDHVQATVSPAILTTYLDFLRVTEKKAARRGPGRRPP